MSERRIRTRCACGWETSGPVDAVVEATLEHGTRVHNMTGTRDQVLERAEVVDDGETSGAGRGIGGS
jgi:predicted small metal-binding protein